MKTPLDLARLSDVPFSEEIRRIIVNECWKVDYTTEQYAAVSGSFCAYFRYFEAQCTHSRTSVKTLREMLDIIHCMKERNASRDSLRQMVLPNSQNESTNNDEDTGKASIALAARLWLMIHVGTTGPSLIPGHRDRTWEGGSLGQFMDTTFSSKHELGVTVKLEKIFNVRNLEKIAGIKISWTNNLADHLSMKDDDTRVVLFTHATFLEHHREYNR